MALLVRSRLLALLLILLGGTAQASRFTALCYHDVVDRPAADPFAVSSDRLVALFDYLVAHGYTPVSVDDLVAAREGRRPLPDKAVLLSFDDGLKSTYTKVFPLLKAYRFPAVVAVVGSWLEVDSGSVAYGTGVMDRSQFVSWEELREMQASGLVEVASHSYDLHQGIVANPQGDLQPAAVTRAYRPAAGSYETEAEYRARLRADLARSSEVIERRLGKRPRVMVWPYGAYNADAVAVARELGMDVTLTLDSADADTAGLAAVPRVLIQDDPDLASLVPVLDTPSRRPAPMRVMHVDLDYVYDADPAQSRRNLDRLLDRVKAFRITHVFLQAYADPDGDGVADSLYFPNRHLPLRADLFDHVAWRLRTRSGVQVYAWMPMLAFQLPEPERNRALAVRPTRSLERPSGDYHRLSPFLSEARGLIHEIYEDLGRHSQFAGVLFHDDGFLRDYEDAHAPGLRAADKTAALVEFSLELAETLRRNQPELKTARNLFARPVLEPRSEEWFAQSLPAFLAAYDFTAVMAMPWMEGEGERAEHWLARLGEVALSQPGAADKLVFELQAKDWRSGRRLDTALLARHMRLLQVLGVRHLGYYPDDFVGNHPDFEAMRPAFSASDHPYRLQ